MISVFLSFPVLISILLIIFLLTTDNYFFFTLAQEPIVDFPALSPPTAPGQTFSASAYDASHSYAYFGGAGPNDGDSPQFCRFNTAPSSDFTLESCIAAPSRAPNNRLKGSIMSLVIDPFNNAAYVATTQMDRSAVCKADISPNKPMAFLSPCIDQDTSISYFTASIIDAKNSFAYFAGSDDAPYGTAQVCKFDISPSNFALSSCIPAPKPPGAISVNGFSSPIFDEENGVAYFGATHAYSAATVGVVCKLFLSNFSFYSPCLEPTEQLAYPRKFSSAAFDPKQELALFSGYGQNFPYLWLVDTSPTNFDVIYSSQEQFRNNPFGAAVIDQNSVIYFASDTSLTARFYPEICSYKISRASRNFFDFLSCTTVDSQWSFGSAVVHSGVMYLGASRGNVVRVFLNALECINTAGVNILTITPSSDFDNSSSPINVLSTFSCKVVIEDVMLGAIAFLSDVFETNISIRNVTFTRLSASSPCITFARTLTVSSMIPNNVDLSGISTAHPLSGGGGALIHFDSSQPFQTPTTYFRLTDNAVFTGDRLVSAPPAVDLSNSIWTFDCNGWPNGYNKQFQEYSNEHLVSRVELQCPRTHTPSRSVSQTNSASKTQTISPSISVTSTQSDTIYCLNFDQVTCNTLPHQCKFCTDVKICVPVDKKCDQCELLTETKCNVTNGVCKFCSEQQVCVHAATPCTCVNFTATECTLASAACNYCASEIICVPKEQACGCASFTASVSSTKNNDYCTASPACNFCPDQQVCLPSATPCTCHDMDRRQCNVSDLSSRSAPSATTCKYCFDLGVCVPNPIECKCTALPSQVVCQVPTECHWCSEYSTCAEKSSWPDCKCTSLPTSNVCGVNSNNKCSWCQTESVCADPNYKCVCELFPKSVCDVSKCNWCSTLDACTIEENVLCNCNYLKTPEKCASPSNSQCKWCDQNDLVEQTFGPSKVFTVVDNFSYCVHKSIDRCECSYLSPNFCKNFLSPSSSSPSSSSPQYYSTKCKYCTNLQLCTRQENTDCSCALEYSQRGCSDSGSCTLQPPVLTLTEGALTYCSKAAAVGSTACSSPVSCEGIKDSQACASSGCTFDPSTNICGTGPCFSFFIPGFTPQPFLLYFVGLFKDVLVLLLVGAIGDHLTRFIMNKVVTAKKWCKSDQLGHLEQKIASQALYMSDRICRNGYSFSFPEYVEQICEDMFEFVDENGNPDTLDEMQRLALFDITAFCLSGNLLWIEPTAVFDDADAPIREQEITGASIARPSASTATAPPDDQRQETLLTNEPPSSARKRRFSMKMSTPRRPTNSSSQYSPPNQDEEQPAQATATTPRTTDDRAPSSNNEDQLTSSSRSVAQPPASEQVQSPSTPLVTKLKAEDFKTFASLRGKVEVALVERASSFIYYAQSRDTLLSMSAAINSFPSVLQLIAYTVMVSFLYITSFITVQKFPSITQVVSGCNSFTPQNSGATFTGAFLLLGFRVMNASASATSVLILVKTVRGLYQKFTGLYDLSLAQRIPLMGLFSDRAIQITLVIYTLAIAPFALAGPFYGGFAIGWQCWIPIFVGAFVVGLNWLVLYAVRKIARDERARADRQKTEDDVKRIRAQSLLDVQLDDDNIETGSSVSRSNINNDINDDDDFEQIIDMDPRRVMSMSTDDTASEVSLATMVSSATRSKSRLQREKKRKELLNESETGQLADVKLTTHASIASAAPTKLVNAIIVFLLTEEIPVIAVSLALQVSFNYLCLLKFKDAFSLNGNENDVFAKDFNNRRLECNSLHLENDASTLMSTLTSFIPF